MIHLWADRGYWRRRLTCWHDWQIVAWSWKGDQYCAKCGVFRWTRQARRERRARELGLAKDASEHTISEHM